ncbi:MAG TPA: class I SAM-dependent methyltransferase [Edaphobacter sp.]|nr:class I SAM-dependent methyltransferase [Edaphobacter sp.]
MDHAVIRTLRTKTFTRRWPLDEQMRAAAATVPSHFFLQNPAGQNLYVYLSRFVKEMSERHFGRPFGEITVLDWGCGKGQMSKLIRDLNPKQIDSCDLLTNNDDSAFGQKTPIIDRFGIQVKPLEHEYVLPYEDASFDVILSVGVLEHVPKERASLLEIMRVLKPGGLFFCFFLPTNLSWTQKLAHLRGNFYHDRFYNEQLIKELTKEAGLEILDFWYRQFFPKNNVRYPNYYLFEKMDQFITQHTFLKYFATNIEFVSVKPHL